MPTSAARDRARLIADCHAACLDGTRTVARRLAGHFERREWREAQQAARERLTLYAQHVFAALAGLRGRDESSAEWTALRDAYAAEVAGRADHELAETFFNSVTRRRFDMIGVHPTMEFLRPWADEPFSGLAAAGRCWVPAGGDATTLARCILSGIPHPLADAEDDARRVGRMLGEAARESWRSETITGAEMLAQPFYRGQAAYVVGRLHGRGPTIPLLLALRSTERGVEVDAVLTTADELSIVFGFAWSYLHADLENPGATVEFLRGLMPQKRIDELYTALGYNKHGKTVLYRLLSHHVAQEGARFEEAEGIRGLVMAVVTLPSLNIVLKLIKDRIGHSKSTTRAQVMEQYHRVFLHDRAGRLADAQLFQGLSFPRRCFPEPLLAELLHDAPSAVRLEGDAVVLDHLYTERRLRPLNLFLQEVPESAADAAILDYGEAIRDLAATNIFAGDLLLKNFGVSRHGRVIFYDYDELAPLTGCNFRRMPQPRSHEEEMAAEPWFAVGEHDVFPEEFMPFLVPAGRLRDLFLEAHRDLLDPDWWRAEQERQRTGEIVETFPYPAARRFRRDVR